MMPVNLKSPLTAPATAAARSAVMPLATKLTVLAIAWRLVIERPIYLPIPRRSTMPLVFP